MMVNHVFWTPPVNNYTTYKTILPPTIKLKPKEIEELSLLEERFEAYIQNTDSENDVKISSTTNIGVHYFCVENGVGLKILASNKKISPDIAFLILCKLDDIATVLSSSDAYYELLNNPVVYKNLDLFNIVLEETYKLDGASTLTLLFRSAAYMPISSLMAVMIKAGSSNNNFVKKGYLQVASVRSVDILAYVKEKTPELGEVPLTWVLKAYGF